MSSTFFNRNCVVTIGSTTGGLSVQVGSRDAGANFLNKMLRVQFKIHKNKASTMNTGDLTLYNLTKSTRTKLQEKNAPVTIEAGYIGNIGAIFLGNMTISNQVKQGADWVSKYAIGTSVQSFKAGRLNKPYPPGTPKSNVIMDLISTLGYGLGNAEIALTNALMKGAPNFEKGFAVTGKASLALDKIIDGIGLEYSVQDGAIQILEPGSSNQDSSVYIDKSHGLIGNAEQGEDKNKKPVVKVRSLLQATLVPGRVVVLNSEDASGNFTIESVTHSGDTWGTEWYSDLELLTY